MGLSSVLLEEFIPAMATPKEMRASSSAFPIRVLVSVLQQKRKLEAKIAVSISSKTQVGIEM
jgi:hypothetical protein